TGSLSGRIEDKDLFLIVPGGEASGMGGREEVAELVSHGDDALLHGGVDHRLFAIDDLDPFAIKGAAFFLVQLLYALLENFVYAFFPRERRLLFAGPPQVQAAGAFPDVGAPMRLGRA